jgi:catechol 2,3-dioxygenase-like lactoylglutathione lyase family enzyme
MLTRIDHVMICVRDLDRAVETYRRLGFTIDRAGVHPGRGTENAVAFFEEDYLELLGVRDPARAAPGEPPVGTPSPALTEFLAGGDGFRYIAVQSDDLAADVAAMRARGVDVRDVTAGSRWTPSGQELRWRSATLGPRDALPIFFIQHLTPLDARRPQLPGAGAHPNGALRLDRAYIAVPGVASTAAQLGRVLGMPVPGIQRGAVIKADMAVFDLGATGLTVAQPAEPGPADEALRRRGPGPFQALYRVRSLDAAARWMADHGVPPPARGTRNTGDQAMLVRPADACGAFIGFFGPP